MIRLKEFGDLVIDFDVEAANIEWKHVERGASQQGMYSPDTFSISLVQLLTRPVLGCAHCDSV